MQLLPGFRDLLPADCAQRNYIFAQWREVARRYGFVEWDGPVLEPTELYKKKSGDEIVGQLFNFTDKGGREVAMRPELTPTLARVVAAHEREFKKPLKWFSIPQCFRYEKQQRGRLREHFQFNADIIGEDSLGADIELVALCIDLLRGFGLGPGDFVVRMSDRQFWIEFLRSHDVPEDRWQATLEIIDKSERQPREKVAAQLGALAPAVFEILDGGGRSERLDHLLGGLQERGLAEFASIDLRIVRGLAYYTGIVFEAFDRAGKLRAIAGGGRYDNLIAQLSDGAVALPALGFAMGDVVLGELLREKGNLPNEQSLDAYVVIAKEERRTDALRLVQELRNAGRRVDFPLAPAKVGKQFQTAETLGAKFAVLFGDEWPQLKVKNLATRAEQLVGPQDLLAHLAR
ncbi:MAG: histidine--tRNA ligase [Verrucomicrobiota bacterium]|nr:histidine--tRNA ligase [Verrucomicrobiota bacterium]